MQKWIYKGTEFKVGDKVMVMGYEEEFAPNTMGDGKEWPNSWIHTYKELDKHGVEKEYPGMDYHIFKEFVIEHIDEEGVIFEETFYPDTLDESGNKVKVPAYAFPLSVLKKLN